MLKLRKSYFPIEIQQKRAESFKLINNIIAIAKNVDGRHIDAFQWEKENIWNILYKQKTRKFGIFFEWTMNYRNCDVAQLNVAL